MNETNTRIIGIDAARGTAMLFSCLAHFSWWLYPAYPQTSILLATVGMIATPTFLLLSGAMTGLLCVSIRYTPLQLKYSLLNRGIFLLTFGHFLVALSESHRDGGFVNTIAGNSIVDEIGLSMVIIALFSKHLSTNKALYKISGLSALAFLLLWYVELTLHPSTHAGKIVRQALLGPDLIAENLQTYTAPTIQYVAIFAMGLSGGGWLATSHDAGNHRRFNSLPMLRVGLALVAAAMTLFTLKFIVHQRTGWPAPWTTYIDRSFQISCKTPPSPAYFFFYAGTGLAITSILLWAAQSRFNFPRNLVGWLSVLGRASLFTFVFQYFLYWTLPDILGIRPGKYAPLLFLVNVFILWYAARWWNSIRGNRMITVGLRAPSAS